ncbi:class I SAM-dependent methyltransferase [Desulfovibrio sp. ZJ200]|uniref:class I SAM-dependent methyltransferase n=1 Tax=Desulfovibrio sp. ZJ200 TaxID=2709792 RepID=UPI001F14A7F4|nr:class I SAM-dependent methyltransferase [Desulfovibrio sp. ZJ200]
MPDASLLLELAEKGIIQIQQKAVAGKRATKVAALQGGKDNIAPYLRQRQKTAQNELTKKLAAKGLWAPFVYDRYLFTTLNEIYADKPLVPQPREISPQSLFAQADKRVDYLQKHFGAMEGADCLEIGCGRGETAVRLSERHSCRVTGVDAHPYPEWPDRQCDHVRFVEVDLTEQSPFSPESFDYIVSFAVLEHVQNPLAMLEVMFELLKPGGKIYLSANLYRGPMASHRYREVFFPWPHLLFEDAVFTRFYRERDGRQGVTPAWVNKLTHLHYLEKIHELGFEILKCTYSRRPFDEDFYQCFLEKLGRYPKGDLEKDFINLMIYKPI